jgi:hypothetical protein
MGLLQERGARAERPHGVAGQGPWVSPRAQSGHPLIVPSLVSCAKRGALHEARDAPKGRSPSPYLRLVWLEFRRTPLACVRRLELGRQFARKLPSWTSFALERVEAAPRQWNSTTPRHERRIPNANPPLRSAARGRSHVLRPLHLLPPSYRQGITLRTRGITDCVLSSRIQQSDPPKLLLGFVVTPDTRCFCELPHHPVLL